MNILRHRIAATAMLAAAMLGRGAEQVTTSRPSSVGSAPAEPRPAKHQRTGAYTTSERRRLRRQRQHQRAETNAILRNLATTRRAGR